MSNKKSKTAKLNHTNTNKYKNKNKNKKLLKKMVKTNSSIDDDIISDESNFMLDEIQDADLLEENIQILIGGGEQLVNPSKFDEFVFGYDKPVDTRGFIQKTIDGVKEVTDTAVSLGTAVASKAALKTIGYNGKTPEEVSEEIKNDVEAIKKINETLSTDKEAVQEIQNLANTATGIIGKSLEKIPEQTQEPMEKLGESALKIGVGLATEVPVIAPIIGMSNMVEGAQDAFKATTNAVTNVANLTSDVAQDIKKPIDDIRDKIDEISDISNLPEIDKIPEIDKNIDDEIPKLVKIPDENNVQVGGSDINKFYNVIQHGGKKLKKRINATRHAFKNISKNITKKNKK